MVQIIYKISIHAPRMGSDMRNPVIQVVTTISIHAPRMGSDRPPLPAFSSRNLFQSTLPAWGATGQRRRYHLRSEISIHAPRMGSDGIGHVFALLRIHISIHAPRMGSDKFIWVGGRGKVISIHAPRMGSDVPVQGLLLLINEFQSTLPAWGATSFSMASSLVP